MNKHDSPPAPGNEPRWLAWSKRLQAIAQNGLTFSRDPFEIERYTAIREIAAEIFATASDAPLPFILDLFARETGYATPKVDVRGVLFREEKILLVREQAEGKWSLPGGWADVCESAAENVVREIREESGFEARAIKLLAVFDRGKHAHDPPFPRHVYKLFFLCEITGGSASTLAETDAVGFFKETGLPELSISRVTKAQILRFFEHHRNPTLPADFD